MRPPNSSQDDAISAEGSRIVNRLSYQDRAFHDWYRFVLSFPPHLVRDYFADFGLQPGQRVLDPFCGTGTTLVEAKLLGIHAVGVDANPMAHLACSAKTSWQISPEALIAHGESIAAKVRGLEAYQHPRDLRSLPDETQRLLLKNSISPRPLHQALLLLEHIPCGHNPFQHHEYTALARAVVADGSNLYFGPEVGVGRKRRDDAPVVESWLRGLHHMAADLSQKPQTYGQSEVHHADARDLTGLLEPQSIDAVFTSPPYPNEKDYTRTTRLETVLLGLIQTKADLRTLKQGLLRSNTRNVYSGDRDDDWIRHNQRIQTLAHTIEAKRLRLGKTSGFEQKYHRVTRLYFGGMAKHLENLKPLLKPGATLGYVVGDQASYLQIKIPTGQLLAEIAADLGYQIRSIDLFRARRASATQQLMREEVLVLSWPG